MNLAGNIIWLLFGGFLSALGWVFAGLICCATIIGIPFGLQCFKTAGLVLTPFGKELTLGKFGLGGAIGNVIWIIFLGWELCLIHLFWGIIFSLSIIGIPFGQQHFKLAALSLIPFGAEVS